MDRFPDDLHLVAADEYQPTMVAVLLRREGLENAAPDAQERAIGGWLRSNRPTPMMEYSIRHSGFGHLLD